MKKWQENQISLLLGNDERLAKKLELTIRISSEWARTLKETLDLITLWKQPFPNEFKRWLKKNVKTRHDLESLRKLLARRLIEPSLSDD